MELKFKKLFSEDELKEIEKLSEKVKIRKVKGVTRVAGIKKDVGIMPSKAALEEEMKTFDDFAVHMFKAGLKDFAKKYAARALAYERAYKKARY